MSNQRNEALARTFLDALWNLRRLDIADQLITDDYILHVPQGQIQGKEALNVLAESYYERFSAIQVNVGRQTSDDSQVVTFLDEWHIILDLIDRSDAEQVITREIPLSGVSIDRVDQELIAESWYMVDQLYFLFNFQQLSRNPAFVRTAPALKNCPCYDGWVCGDDGCCHYRGITR